MLYRPGKAPDRFFDNPRNVQERAHPELVAINSERSFELFFYPCSALLKKVIHTKERGSGNLRTSFFAIE